MLLAAATFFLLCGFNLYLGKWLYAAFHFMAGFLVLKGKAIERWPRAARYLLIIAYAAVAVAMFFQLIFDVKAMK